MPPILPIIELEFIIVLRRFVGHISAVKLYKITNAHVIDPLLTMKSNKTNVDLSSGIHGVMIIVDPLINKIVNNTNLRGKRFINGIAKSEPGISTAET